MKKSPLNIEQSLKWSQMAQTCVLQALMENKTWKTNSLVFHGGTSLHLSWNSPRFSEDLDFLLSRDVQNIDQIMQNVHTTVKEIFYKEDALFKIEILNKTKDEERMPVYHVKIGHDNFLGKALIKVEFWRVSSEYLEKYPVQLRTPKNSDWVADTYPVPAADLETAFCDKLTAFATRPFLKWRDIYDLWWIGTQTDADLDIQKILPQFKHNLSGYEDDMQNALAALDRFLAQDRSDMVQQADPDLKKWLPPKLWERMTDGGVDEMVDYSIDVLSKIKLLLIQPDTIQSIVIPKRLKK